MQELHFNLSFFFFKKKKKLYFYENLFILLKIFNLIHFL
jgi:hypothetical protein